MKKLLIISIAITLMFVLFLAACTTDGINEVNSGDPVSREEPPVEPIELGILPNRVEIAEHLNDVVFNAQFLHTPTYDGSNQLVHPHVLHFPDQFLGFYYLMVMTPYPHFTAAYENPSILGSQDGVNWVVPEGIENPVVGIPPDADVGGHFSDPFLLRVGDTLELWWRRNVVREVYEGQWIQDGMHNRIYRKTTTDLVNWTEREIILDCPYNIDNFMSVVVMRYEDMYRVFYTNFDLRMFMIESYDLVNWTPRKYVPLVLGEWGIWHQEFNYIGEIYQGLFTTLERAPYNSPIFPVHRLFVVESEDGVNFEPGAQILIEAISPELEGMTIHKSSFILKDGYYQMYFAMYGRDRVWHVFYFEIAQENLHMLFED